MKWIKTHFTPWSPSTCKNKNLLNLFKFKILFLKKVMCIRIKKLSFRSSPTLDQCRTVEDPISVFAVAVHLKKTHVLPLPILHNRTVRAAVVSHILLLVSVNVYYSELKAVAVNIIPLHQ